MKPSLRVLAALLPAAAIQIATGCSDDRSVDVATGVAETPIIGGVADTTNTWVVGIDIGGAGICSGSLIAPNLVLTARHCVSKTPNALDCDPAGGLTTDKILGNYPASTFRVTTAQRIGGSPQWTVKSVRYIDDPAANQLCGYDLALLELNKNGSGAFPTKWMAPSVVGPKKANYVAAGYGCQNPDNPSGGGCDPRGYRMFLDPVSVIEIALSEFAIKGRVCGGDSGGPVWNATTQEIFGALSRGDGSTSTAEGCNFGLYTRTDAHLDWLQKYGKIAAANGGYAPLPWMSATKPVPDAGPPPPPKEPLGSACTAPKECQSALCVDFGGDTRCSQTCTAARPCPSGFECNGGYCYQPAPPADAGPAPDTDTDGGTVGEDPGATPASDTVKGGTCAVVAAPGTPPPRPLPWITAGLIGVAAVLVRRRSR